MQVFLVYQSSYSNLDLALYYGFTVPEVSVSDYAQIRGIDFTVSAEPGLPEDEALSAIKRDLVALYDLQQKPLKIFPKKIGSLLMIGLRIKFLASVEEAKAFKGGVVHLRNEMHAHKYLLKHLLARVLHQKTLELRGLVDEDAEVLLCWRCPQQPQNCTPAAGAPWLVLEPGRCSNFNHCFSINRGSNCPFP